MGKRRLSSSPLGETRTNMGGGPGEDVKTGMDEAGGAFRRTTRSRSRRKLGPDGAGSGVTGGETVSKPRTARPRLARVKSEPGLDSDSEPKAKGNALPIDSPLRSAGFESAKAGTSASAQPLTAPTPPPLWKKQYTLTQRMRARLPPAAVDTMGCAHLADRTAPRPTQRFQTLVALMLSSQTKDEVTAAAIRRLQTSIPAEAGGFTAAGIASFESHPDDLNRMIGSVGFHNTKTKNLIRVGRECADRFGGDIPDTAEGLVALPGVGPKMAFLTLGAEAGWGRADGIGVDVHVHRVVNRWGWCRTADPEHTRRALQAWLPKPLWRDINPLLVGFGQLVCGARPKCGQCDLAAERACPSAFAGADGVGAGAGARAVVVAKVKAERRGRGKEKEKGVGNGEVKLEVEKDEEDGSPRQLLVDPDRLVDDSLNSVIRSFSHAGTGTRLTSTVSPRFGDRVPQIKNENRTWEHHGPEAGPESLSTPERWPTPEPTFFPPLSSPPSPTLSLSPSPSSSSFLSSCSDTSASTFPVPALPPPTDPATLSPVPARSCVARRSRTTTTAAATTSKYFQPTARPGAQGTRDRERTGTGDTTTTTTTTTAIEMPKAAPLRRSVRISRQRAGRGAHSEAGSGGTKTARGAGTGTGMVMDGPDMEDLFS